MSDAEGKAPPPPADDPAAPPLLEPMEKQRPPAAPDDEEGRNRVIRLVFGVFCLVVLAAGAGYYLGTTAWTQPRPVIGGQEVPEKGIVLDFAKEYTFHCHFNGGKKVFERCKVVGMLGRARSGTGVAGGSLIISTATYYPVFENWLVIQYPDGRKAYLPARSIEYFEDPAEGAK